MARLAALQHARHEGPDAVHDTPHVDVHEPLPLFQARLGQWPVGGHACVVAEDVDLAISVEDGRCQPFDSARIGDVHEGRHDVGPTGQFGLGRVEGRFVDVRQNQTRTSGGECSGHRQSDTRRSPGDDGDRTVESIWHACNSSS